MDQHIAETTGYHDAQWHAHGHHEESFVTKYIFSQDHKVIAKQFLITGIFWAFIGGVLSSIFRLQLGYPDMSLEWLRPLLGGWITDAGKLDPEFYLALVTMHGTIMVFFVLTAGLSGTFSNFLIRITNRCPGHGLRFPEHAVILVLFCFQCSDAVIILSENRTGSRWLGDISPA